MEKSARNGRKAGQWLAAQTEKGPRRSALRPEIALRRRNQPRFNARAEQHYWMARFEALFSVALARTTRASPFVKRHRSKVAREARHPSSFELRLSLSSLAWCRSSMVQ
jgi:hypothetical protein